MFKELSESSECSEIWHATNPQKALETPLGGIPLHAPLSDMIPIWSVSMQWFNGMYKLVMMERSGIG